MGCSRGRVMDAYSLQLNVKSKLLEDSGVLTLEEPLVPAHSVQVAGSEAGLDTYTLECCSWPSEALAGSLRL